MTSYVCIPAPYDEKYIFFLVLVLEGLVGLIIEPFRFFSISGWGIELDYCDIEWFALEMNRDYSVIEIEAKYCILDSFVEYEGNSISSKGFLFYILFYI